MSTVRLSSFGAEKVVCPVLPNEEPVIEDSTRVDFQVRSVYVLCKGSFKNDVTHVTPGYRAYIDGSRAASV